MLVLGGGGYTLRNVARAWTHETSILSDCDIPNEIPYSEYFEFFSPDFTLLLDKCNLQTDANYYFFGGGGGGGTAAASSNHNTRQYLDNITRYTLDMLKELAFAPSVQMQDVPDVFGPQVKAEENGEDDESDDRMDANEMDESGLLLSSKEKDNEFYDRRSDSGADAEEKIEDEAVVDSQAEESKGEVEDKETNIRTESISDETEKDVQDDEQKKTTDSTESDSKTETNTSV